MKKEKRRSSLNTALNLLKRELRRMHPSQNIQRVRVALAKRSVMMMKGQKRKVRKKKNRLNNLQVPRDADGEPHPNPRYQ
jgi:hypothetical protein